MFLIFGFNINPLESVNQPIKEIMTGIQNKANFTLNSVELPIPPILQIFSNFLLLLSVDIKYCLNGMTEERKNIKIGRMPIMLGCSRCHLVGKS